MQTLGVTVKKRGPEGVAEVMQQVTVIRSFHSSAGTVYLHSNGVFGYKDGSPIRSEKDLEIIGPVGSLHRRVAERWWNSRGKAQSAAYYAALEAEQEGLLDDYLEQPDVLAESELDAVLYKTRRGKGQAVSGPRSWQECGFKTRPDWWGQADQIAFGNVSYYRYVEGEGPVQPDQDPADPSINQTPGPPPAVPPAPATTATTAAPGDEKEEPGQSADVDKF